MKPGSWETWRAAGLPDDQWLAAGGDPAAVKAEDEVDESVPGLRDWLWSRGCADHFVLANKWCEEMGAADFQEVADNAVELAEYLGPNLTADERDRLTRGSIR